MLLDPGHSGIYFVSFKAKQTLCLVLNKIPREKYFEKEIGRFQIVFIVYHCLLLF